MNSIPRSHTIMFAIICAAALLVAVFGSFLPVVLADMLSWLQLPPLHARFVGALYFYGAIFMIGCMRARYQSEVRYALMMIAIWTGLLFVVSILSLGAFDFTRLPVWIWFASYSIYPVIAMILTWRDRNTITVDLPGPRLAGWAYTALIIQGLVVGLLALALLLIPGVMVAVWPWKITPLLAQTYGGPLLAYSVGSILFARRRTWLAVRAVVPAMFVFTAGVLLASFIHRGLFSASDLADWIWFLAFGTMTALLGAMTARVLGLQPGA
ncbi:MAG: hypothetical protein SH847_12110 [Roseiflexaceae bacterium]|nr:hypothetical protein [Roseiflexaceae bacterium]